MYLVLSVSSYSFKNDNGETIAGYSIHAVDEPVNERNHKGFKVTKFALPEDTDIEFPVVPGYYDFDMGFKPVGGKAQAVIKAALYLRPLVLDFYTYPEQGHEVKK